MDILLIVILLLLLFGGGWRLVLGHGCGLGYWPDRLAGPRPGGGFLFIQPPRPPLMPVALAHLRTSISASPSVTSSER
jgi:hypothetical protein